MRLKRFTVTLVLLFVVVFLASDAKAQKIYLLAVGDTSKESKVATHVEAAQDLVRSLFYANVPEDQLVPYGHPEGAWSGLKIQGNEPDLDERLAEAIRQCPASPNDTIVVYFLAHGSSSNKKHSMQMPEGKIIPREFLSNALRKKKVRLAVFMTESCTARFGICEGLEMAAPEGEGISLLFKSLFVDSKGFVDFNSSTEPELSLTLSATNEIDGTQFSVGGVMIYSMFSVMAEHRNERLSWSKFKDYLTKKQDEVFKAAFPDGVTHDKEGLATHGWVQKTQTPHFFSLPNGNSYRRHNCFLRRFFQRFHYRHHRHRIIWRCHCQKVYQTRTGCCR